MKKEIGFLYEDKGYEGEYFVQNIKDIFLRLQDEMSKDIFKNRLLFSLTEDARFMREVVLSNLTGRKMYEKFREINGSNVYIYGAGLRGKRLAEMFPEIVWKGFIDANKRGLYGKLPIIHIEDLDINENTTIIISIASDHDKVKKQLMTLGIEEKKIIILNDYNKEIINGMYFDSIVGKMKANEYFIDAGGFDGQTTLSYLKKYFPGNEKNAKAIIFEPDIDNYKICKISLHGYKKVEIKNSALYNNNSGMKFQSGNGQESCMSIDGEETVTTETLDSLLAQKAVGFIKMDVEGTEVNAIVGAKNIITAQAPKLAISIYHKKSDIWKIPVLLLKLNPNYLFYLRHYTISYSDTVLYAINKKS